MHGRLHETTFERIARILSEQYGLTVRFQGTGASVALDKKVMTLPSLAEPTPRLKTVIDGFVDHEVGHLKFTDGEVMHGVPNQLVRGLFNQLEDVRVNREMADWKVGCGENIARASGVCIAEGRERIPGLSDEEQIFWTVYLLWDGVLQPSDLTNPVVANAIDKVRHLLPRVGAMSSTHDALALAKEVADILFEERMDPPPPEPEDGDEEQAEDESDEDESDEDGSDEDGFDEDEGPSGGGGPGEDEESDEADEDDEGEQGGGDKDKSGDRDDEDDEDDEGRDTGNEGEGEDDGSGPSDAVSSEDGAPTIGDVLEEYLVDGGKPFDMGEMLQDAIREIAGREMIEDMRTHKPFSTRYDKVHEDWLRGGPLVNDPVVRKVRPIARAVINRLEQALLARERVKYVPEQERGRLDGRSLHKVLTGTSTRVFKERVQSETRNVAVSLVVDCSYSMVGHKVEQAREAAAVFSLALHQLGIVHEVVGFSTTESRDLGRAWDDFRRENPAVAERYTRTEEPLWHTVVKPFGSDKANFQVLQAKGNNVDGESILWAARRLAIRKEPRRVMIVLSDGNPCAHGPSYVFHRHLQEVVPMLNSAGIHTIGVGIDTHAVEQYYPDFIVIEDAEALRGTVMRQLERILVQGVDRKSLKRAA